MRAACTTISNHRKAHSLTHTKPNLPGQTPDTHIKGTEHMKLSLTLVAAALAASVAAPALAADSTQFAIDHLNRSADTVEQRITVGPNGPVLGTTVSSMGDNAIGAAISHFNASQDVISDRVNADTVTVFSGGPAHAADIFEQLRAASLEDE